MQSMSKDENIETEQTSRTNSSAVSFITVFLKGIAVFYTIYVTLFNFISFRY